MALIYNIPAFSSQVKATFTNNATLENEKKQPSLCGDSQRFYLYRCMANK